MKFRTQLSALSIFCSLCSSTHAVHLDPGGRGQVLIYPYYTVNNHQQTLLSVTNASSVAQALKVRFNEGYNGRAVRDFNLFLSPFDSWTGTVFALRDAGIDNDGAALLSSDTSCTAPMFSEDLTSLGGTPYIAFRDSAFRTPDDGGPYTIDRTREGYIEIYAMVDVAAPLAAAFVHGGNGSAPTGCSQVQSLQTGNAAFSPPTGGLMGAVSVINVAQGTFLSVRAEALGGFTGTSLFTGVQSILPNLNSVNDGVGPLAARATAQVFASVSAWPPYPMLSTLPADLAGKTQTLTFPGPDSRSRKVDAVSAVFMADRIYNGYQISPALDAASDWLVTMPTKSFYVDPLYLEPSNPLGQQPTPPFPSIYSGNHGGSPTSFMRFFYDDKGIQSGGWSCFPSGCYAREAFATHSVNVMPVSRLAVAGSEVLGSHLISNINQTPVYGPESDAGWMHIGLSAYYGVLPPTVALLPSAEGKVLLGLPVMGFWAMNIVNNNVIDGVLANYSAAVRHSTSVTCVKTSDGKPCD